MNGSFIGLSFAILNGVLSSLNLFSQICFNSIVMISDEFHQSYNRVFDVLLNLFINGGIGFYDVNIDVPSWSSWDKLIGDGFSQESDVVIDFGVFSF